MSAAGRNETELERSDRNLHELLQELRVVQTGVQVLFAFLLSAPLASGFGDLSSTARIEYYLTLSLSGIATILLIAPTALHRGLFQQDDKKYLVRVADRLTIAGLAAVGLAIAGAMTFVTTILEGATAGFVAGGVTVALCSVLWLWLPLARRRKL